MPGTPRSGDRVRGFTLIETLVALALVAVALLMSMGVAVQQARAERRLALHAQALRAAETALERVRGGTLPLATGRMDDYAPILVWLEVEAAGPPGLYSVEARATYTLHGQMRARRLVTRIWRHPEGPIG
jgi:prepilin-type N-terminal cleavage/methylation domain-containing protein